ncbi:MAG: oligosaccharide flippase family protein [Verrucomicrobiales bacterium]|nr:oligosaccharide flippase family protein [Verrucomicrobiales bacterium]
MNLRRTALRGSALLAAAAVLSNGAGFARNVMLAHALSKADFGIAATLGLVISLFELSAKIGISRFVVQDPEGDTREFIGAAHFFQFVVAAIGALMIVVASPILANLFGIPDHRWALASIAVIALLRGIEHLDVSRFERKLRFGPSTAVDAISQVLLTGATWPVTRWFPDYRAMLILLLAKSFLTCALSHYFADYSYRWVVQRSYFQKLLVLSWPLLINGFLMFGVLQGDQFMVATFYNPSELASYAAAAVLVSAPTFLFTRILSSLSLPLLASAQSNPQLFQRRYEQSLAVVTVWASAVSVVSILGSETIMLLIYGSKYSGSGLVLAWIAGANAFRILRIAPTTAALSRGDSKAVMYTNLLRVVSLLPAFVVATRGSPIWVISTCATIGEACACTAAFRFLSRRDGILLSTNLIPIVVVGSSITCTLGWIHVGSVSADPAVVLATATLTAAVAASIAVILLPRARQECIGFFRQVASTGFAVGVGHAMRRLRRKRSR